MRTRTPDSPCRSIANTAPSTNTRRATAGGFPPPPAVRFFIFHMKPHENVIAFFFSLSQLVLTELNKLTSRKRQPNAVKRDNSSLRNNQRQSGCSCCSSADEISESNPASYALFLRFSVTCACDSSVNLPSIGTGDGSNHPDAAFAALFVRVSTASKKNARALPAAVTLLFVVRGLRIRRCLNATPTSASNICI